MSMTHGTEIVAENRLVTDRTESCCHKNMILIANRRPLSVLFSVSIFVLHQRLRSSENKQDTADNFLNNNSEIVTRGPPLPVNVLTFITFYVLCYRPH